MNINAKVVIFLIIGFFLIYIVNKFNILSSILSSGVIAFLGYIILYKFCAILCEKKKLDLNDLIVEYGINGITRIFLETFKIFAEKIYFISIRYNYFEFFLRGLFFQKDKQKPTMKDNKYQDRILMFQYLIDLLDKDKKTDNFKHTVETIWLDKWSFFAHFGYVNKILYRIGDLCYENNLPIITFLISYEDESLSKKCFQQKWEKGQNGWIENKLKSDYKTYFVEFQKYVNKMVDNKDKYKKVLEDYKKKVNYGK